MTVPDCPHDRKRLARDECDRRVSPVRIAPDPARDARVAARRAEDAAKAGRALDNLLRSQGAMYRNRVAAGERFIEELGDYLVSRLQHNRAYGVASEIPRCTCDEPSGMSGCEQHMPIKLTMVGAETWCFDPRHPHGEAGMRLDECLAARREPGP